MTIVVLLLAWLLGVWLAALPAWSPLTWIITAVPLTIAALLTYRRKRPALIFAALAAFAWGGARYTTAVPAIDHTHIAAYNGRDAVILTGLVDKEPDIRDNYINLTLRAQTLQLADDTPFPVRGHVLVRTNRFPLIPYGARLQIRGALETPPEFDDFSYKEYLARQGVHSLISFPQVDLLAEGEGSPFLHAVLTFKQRARAVINRQLSDPQAALLTGILLGDDNGIPPDLEEDFRATGMTHIIAISGFNIAILAGIFVGLGQRFLAKRAAAVLAVAGIAAYTILVGAEPSVVRAAIMGSAYLFTSFWLGRPTFIFGSLFLAAFLMTLHNPHTLWNVGFQLSFAATLGLMLYADPLIRWTRRRLSDWFDKATLNSVMGLASDAVLITIAAQILTLPLIVYYFDQLSLVSPLANALILPAQPGVMIWGGAATLAGMVAPPLGQIVAWVAWIFLSYTIFLVRMLAALPHAVISLSLPPAALVIFYGGVAALTWLAKQDEEKRMQVLTFLRQNLTRRLALGVSLITAVLTIAWSATQPDGRLHVAFLDVGQGDAIFIQTPSGRQLLIDGGHQPTVLNDQLGAQMPFWDREIDLLIATHPDADHVSGLVGVFDRYRVEKLITNGQGMGESSIYDALLQAAESHETPVHPAQAGEIITIDDGVRLEVLHPGETLSDDRNENSVVLRLSYGDFSLLLTGDAEAASEQRLLADGRSLSSLILKAGHHGANTSSTLPFLTAVTPQIVIISAGEGNRFGHPKPEMLARAEAVGAAILRTDELGPIEVITDGETMWWQGGPK